MPRHSKRISGLPFLLGVGALITMLTGCGGSPSSSPVATPPASATAAPPPNSGPFPTPQEETYHGCPPRGDGGDAQLNVLKNRIDTAPWQSVPLQSLLNLTWPPGVEKMKRDTWSRSAAAAVALSEGRPVITDGYLLMVRHEGPESPNCHDPNARDYHMWLATSPSDTRANAMIVELAPRVVARNPGWGSEANILRLAGHHVRIAGWLMLDQEHPEQLHKTRGTLWEIHPVMRIDVNQNGTWANLASGLVSLGAGPLGRGTGSGQSGRGHAHRSPHSRHRHRHRHRHRPS